MKEKTHGHFFTIVVVRHQGKTEFFIADSANNASHLEDPLTTEIICRLDDAPIPEASTSWQKKVLMSALAGSGVYLIRKLLAKKKKKDVEQLDNATDQIAEIPK